ncbi:unnamed protein product [Eretmochelys imbricata]
MQRETEVHIGIRKILWKASTSLLRPPTLGWGSSRRAHPSHRLEVAGGGPSSRLKVAVAGGEGPSPRLEVVRGGPPPGPPPHSSPCLPKSKPSTNACCSPSIAARTCPSNQSTSELCASQPQYGQALCKPMNMWAAPWQPIIVWDSWVPAKYGSDYPHAPTPRL